MRPIHGTLCLAIAITLVGCATQSTTSSKPLVRPQSTEPRAIATGFLNKAIVKDGQEWRYVVYVPADYDPAEKWPMILFLHGAGERGTDGLIQSEVGIGTAIRRHHDWFPAIVVFPQCPPNCFWDAILDELDACIAKTRASYNVDPKRVYLTGLSMGGYGSWIWGATKTGLFAAMMPICGGGSLLDIGGLSEEPLQASFGTLQERVGKLATVPIWALHGADDQTVPPLRSQQMVKLVKEAGGDVQYTEFADTGHNSWDKAYAKRKAINWLLKQRKR